MKVIITRSTFVRGQAVSADPQPVEMPDALAKELIALNKVVAAPVTPVVTFEPGKLSAGEKELADALKASIEAAVKKQTGGRGKKKDETPDEPPDIDAGQETSIQQPPAET